MEPILDRWEREINRHESRMNRAQELLKLMHDDYTEEERTNIQAGIIVELSDCKKMREAIQNIRKQDKERLRE